jgi:starch-binding outer membrane protein, SusD/RagB family
MKNIKILLVLIFAGFASGCGEEFLSSEPITEKTDANYYKTPQEAQEALVGCYDALQLIWSGDGIALPLAADVMSDLCFGGTGAGDAENFKMIDEYDPAVSPSDLNMFEGNWINYYKGIYRCNVLIGKINQVDWSKKPELKTQIEAEARFLRAFFYFDLVRMFEKVPLLTRPSLDNVPQSNADAIYNIITDDLIFAVNHGSPLSYNKTAVANYGHAGKWAAQALLARVYLYYTGYYGKPDLVGKLTKADALKNLEDVIANSGYDLLSNYSDLWPAASTSAAADAGKPITENTYAGENNKEILFSIKYTYTSDYNGNTDGNHWMVMNGLRNQSWGARGYGNGWGGCTVVPEFYKNWNVADKRRSASVMAIAEENIKYNQVADVREYTGYFTKKYTPTCDKDGNSPVIGFGGVNFMIGQYQDYYCVRFADVLLMAAELESPNALNYLNRVRTRAGLSEVSAITKDIIFDERKYEFAFEGMRYWDMLRYDNTLNYAQVSATYNGKVKNGGVEAIKIINGNKLKSTRGLFQIPNNQITLSGGVLKQNQGWN